MEADMAPVSDRIDIEFYIYISAGIISPPCLHAEIKFQRFIAVEDFSTSHAIQF